MNFDDIVIITGGTSMIGLLFFSFITHFFITEKYNKLFSNHEYLTPIKIPLLHTLGKGLIYASCIVFKNRSKRNKHIHSITGDYDFRKNATTDEVIISFLYVVFATLFLITALLNLFIN